MKKLQGMMMGLTTVGLVLASGARADSSYQVTCKAKLWQTDKGVIALLDLPVVSETDTQLVHDVQIQGIDYQLVEGKLVYNYKPTIKYPDGQEITTGGFFGADGTIQLYSTKHLGNGIDQIADLRCCQDCSFKDWPATDR